MLRGEFEGFELEKYVEEGVFMMTFDCVVNWVCGNVFMFVIFGFVCCVMEMMVIVD